MRQRTLARELALQSLFQHEVWRRVSAEPAGSLTEIMGSERRDPHQIAYATRLVEGVLESLEEIDELIGRAATNWKLSRLASVDRNVLRLALYELLYSPEVPPKVVIDEAINLAKKFSTEQSGAFVNGVLDRIYSDLRLADANADGSPQT